MDKNTGLPPGVEPGTSTAAIILKDRAVRQQREEEAQRAAEKLRARREVRSSLSRSAVAMLLGTELAYGGAGTLEVSRGDHSRRHSV